jgi:hypothetical protein
MYENKIKELLYSLSCVLQANDLISIVQQNLSGHINTLEKTNMHLEMPLTPIRLQNTEEYTAFKT